MNKLKYIIKKENETQSIESKESFAKSCYKSPLITTYLDIVFECNGIEFTAKRYKSSKRLTMYALTLSNWLKDKYPEDPVVTLDRINKALLDTKDKIKTLKVGDELKSSRTEFLFDPDYDQKDEISKEVFNMMKENEEYLYNNNNNFVATLDKDNSTKLDDYLYAYLYKHARGWTVYSSDDNLSSNEIVKSYLSSLLFEIYSFKTNGVYSLDTASGVADLIDLMSDYGLSCDTQCKQLIEVIQKGYKLWDTLDFDTIIKTIKSSNDYDEYEFDEDIVRTLKEKEK